MRTHFQLWPTLLLLAATLGLAGCANTGKVWQARVGTYTFDQAVVELGPPDKQAKLSDGSQVADWLVQASQINTYVSPSFYATPPHYYYPMYPTVTQSRSPDYYLRLVFGADGRLQSWKQYAR